MNDAIIINAGFPRHKHLAREVRLQFRKPVCMTILWEWTEIQMGLTSAEADEIGTVYSLPKEYRVEISRLSNLSIEDLDDLQNSLEKELGVSNNAQLVSHDRNLRKITDYRQSRNIQVLNLLVAKKLFDENNPCLMLGERISYFGNVVGEACKARGIPEIFIFSTLGNTERLAAFDRNQHPYEISKAFNMLQAGELHVPEQLASEADEWLESFIKSPSKPTKSQDIEKSRLKKKLPSFSGVADVFRQYKFYKSLEYDSDAGVLDNPLSALTSLPRRKLQKLLSRKQQHLEAAPDMDQKFFYVPLHYEPELSTLYFGSDYGEVDGFIKRLSKQVPSDHMIYVKEHPSMYGLRPPALYESLDGVYNVKILHPSVSTFDLSNNCSAIITVTGTAGWEGYLLGKPVIVLGNVFFNWFPGVLKASLFDGKFLQRVVSYLEKYELNISERRDIVRAIFLCSKYCNFPSDADLGIHQQTLVEEVVPFYKNFIKFFHGVFTRLEGEDVQSFGSRVE